MQFNTSMKMIAGAVALALSSHVLAQNVVGNGDLYLAVDDATAQSEFLYDTGISASTFNTTASLTPSIDLSTLTGTNATNYSSFLGSESSGDTIQYSVVAGIGTSGNTNAYDLLFGSSEAPGGSFTNGASNNTSLHVAWLAANQEFGGTNVTNTTPVTVTGSEYIPSTNPGGQWYGGGHANTVNANLVVQDSGIFGDALGFYSESITASPNSNSKGATETTFDGTWLLSTAANGDTVLSYTVAGGAPPVPLPAPLLLLVSGLGMMGVLGRRRSGASNEA